VVRGWQTKPKNKESGGVQGGAVRRMKSIGLQGHMAAPMVPLAALHAAQKGEQEQNKTAARASMSARHMHKKEGSE
jgi:hypothetical protein